MNKPRVYQQLVEWWQEEDEEGDLSIRLRFTPPMPDTSGLHRYLWTADGQHPAKTVWIHVLSALQEMMDDADELDIDPDHQQWLKDQGYDDDNDGASVPPGMAEADDFALTIKEIPPPPKAKKAPAKKKPAAKAPAKKAAVAARAKKR